MARTVKARCTIVAASLLLFAAHPAASIQDELERIALWEDTRSLGDEGELLGLLDHGNPEVRARACLALGRIQAPEAIAALHRRLKVDGDGRVRREAAFALGQIAMLHPDPFRSPEGAGAKVIDTLTSLAGEEDAGLRALAAETFGKIGGERASAILVKLAGDEDAETRREAALGLARSRSRDGVPALAGLLGDPSAEVRVAAAYALGRVEGPLPIEELLKATADEDAGVRFSAYQGVRRRQETVGLPLYEKGIGEKDPRVLVEVLWGLAASGSPDRTSDLARHKDSPHQPVRAALARCLGNWEGEKSAGILRSLSADPSPTVRREAVLSWGKREDGLENVILAAGDRHPYVRAGACEALAEWIRRSRDEAVTIFAAPLLSADEVAGGKTDLASRFLSSAVWRTATAGPPGGERVRSLLIDPVAETRAAAAAAAGPISAGIARPQLLGLLGDEDPWVRAEAALTLTLRPGGRIPRTIDDPPAGAAAILAAIAKGDSDALQEAIGRGLRDPEARVRAFSARALEAAGPGEAKLGASVLGDPDPAVVAWAIRALLRSTPDAGDLEEALTAIAAREEAGIRLGLAFLLPEAGAGFAVSLLEKLAADPSTEVRRIAFIHHAWAAGAALTAGVEADEETRRAAVRIARAGRAWRTLQKLAGDDDPVVQAAALKGIALAPSPAVLRRHVAALRSDDPGIASQACTTLRSFPVRAAMKPLLAAYPAWEEPGYAEVRLEIVRTLAAIGDDRSKPILGRALSDPDPAIREEARMAFRARSWAEPEAEPRGGPEPSRHLGATSPLPDRPRVIIEFEKGKVSIDLFPDAAPIHVRSFLAHVEEGFYDGLTIHRVVPNFVIQGGDPLGTGWGYAGVLLRDEINREKYTPGTLGMPKAGKDTGGCQLFITHVSTPWLDGRYTAFGRVTDGLDLIDGIDVGDRIVRVRRIE